VISKSKNLNKFPSKKKTFKLVQKFYKFYKFQNFQKVLKYLKIEKNIFNMSDNLQFLDLSKNAVYKVRALTVASTYSVS
jgi:hypothetical protein